MKLKNFILLIWCLSFSSLALAEDQDNEKSILLFHLFQNLTWSDHSSGQINKKFCGLVQNEHSSVHKLALRQLVYTDGYILKFHFFYNQDDLDEFDTEFKCDLYYFDNVFSNLVIEPLLAKAKRQNKLTIGNGEQFITQGGAISFVSKGKYLSIYINQSMLDTKQYVFSRPFISNSTIVN
ncbi:YfiR/HmsC family protein [Catenovulum maritimum]|uniref:YfiR/HmsC family protein n=1 Tax=Catenovulum maritimum TaxID=1513271 RepID=UPI00155A5515|nr:YfiR/HmsC family protein [Catenovulum maritimum]